MAVLSSAPRRLAVAFLAMVLAACGGGDGSTGAPPITSPPAVQVGSVSVSLPATSLQVGATLTASATVQSTTGASLDRAVTWSVSDASLASITPAGVLTGIAPGAVTITATSEGRSGSAALTIVLAPVNTVVLSTPATSLVTERTMQLMVLLRDERGATLTGRDVTYASSNPAVASVTATGLVTGVSAGAATITATAEGRTGSVNLNVVPPPVASVSVALAQSTVPLATTTTATAQLRDDRGVVLQGRDITWSSANPTVAVVNGTGVITAIGVGTTTILATSEGRSGSATLTVIRPPVASVSVSLAQASLAPGQSTQATGQVLDANGAPLTGREITWSSSNPAVAQVNASGVVTAVSVGQAQVIASSEGRTGQAAITVRSPVASVQVSGASRVKVGDAYPYTVVARTADGAIVERPVTWGVRESARAIVSPTGVVTPLQAGSFTLVARIDGENWEATYTAYDWDAFNAGARGFLTIDADVQLANRFGRSDYPVLTIVCGGTAPFFLWVSVPNMITDNGIVAYSFDNGAPIGDVWDELSPNFDTLWKRGTSGVVRAFAQQVANARRFNFAFGEFNSVTRVANFRVTGLNERLPQLIAAYCPSLLGSGVPPMVTTPSPEMQEQLEGILRARRGVTSSADDADARARSVRGAGTQTTRLLTAWPTWRVPPVTEARRVSR